MINENIIVNIIIIIVLNFIINIIIIIKYEKDEKLKIMMILI